MSTCHSASQTPLHTASLKLPDNTVTKVNTALRENTRSLIDSHLSVDQLNIDDLFSQNDLTA